MASAAMRPSMGALGGRISTCTPAPLRPLTQTASLSTSAALLKRHTYIGARDNKDYSKKRGESALRRTGTRWRLSMSDEPLPKPVPRDRLPAIETDPNHGLWDFFANRKTVAATPAEDSKHGRSWTVEELRHKSWDDLHRLWWVCAKERNRIATSNWEREHSELGFGDAEAAGRDAAVRTTMRAVKHVLTERFYVWEDAVEVAKNDPEVNLAGDGPAFTPRDYLEEGEIEEAAEAAEATEQTTEKTEPATTPPSKAQEEAPRLS